MRVVLAASLLLAGLAAAQVIIRPTPGTFRTCINVDFAEPAFNPNSSGYYPEVNSQLLVSSGVRFVGRQRGDAAARGAPPGGSYTSLTARPLVVFDGARPSGHKVGTSLSYLDVDLGTPNRHCDQPCPARYAGCAICDAVAAGEQGDYLPAGSDPCATYDAAGNVIAYDYLTCPGIGCGGGRWKMTQLSLTDTITYSRRLFNDTVISETQVIPRCQFVEEAGCPVLNEEGNNCEDDTEAHKVLVVQETRSVLNYDLTTPDDNSGGGNIVIIFSQPVTLESMSILDLDDAVSSGGATVAVIRGYASPNENVNTPAEIAREIPVTIGQGDNSRTRFVPSEELGAVSRVVVWLAGSGSIDDLTYCFPRNIEVNITTSHACRYEWTIEKSVNQIQWDLFNGESTAEVFTTHVTKSDTCFPTANTVSGTVQAFAPFNTPIRVTNFRGGLDSDPNTPPADVDVPFTAAQYSCSPYTPSEACPFILVGEFGVNVVIPDPACAAAHPGWTGVFAPGNSLTCTFSMSAPSTAPTNFRAEFVANATAAFPGSSLITGGPITFTSDVVVENDVADVSDVDDPTGVVMQFFPGVSASFSYSSSPSSTCSGGLHGEDSYFRNCTAIVDPSHSGPVSDSAYTVRRCFGLTTTKELAGTYKRTYDWSVDKFASPQSTTEPDCTRFDLDEEDDARTVVYTFQVTAQPVESDFRIDGSITVANHHPHRTAHAVAIADVTFPGATIVCPFTDIPSLGTVTCSVSQALDSRFGHASPNVATATLFGVVYSGSAEWSFTVSETDNTAELVDRFEDELADRPVGVSTAVNDGTLVPQTFTYYNTRDFGPHECPRENESHNEEFPNLATLTWASGSTSDSWNVKVRTYCPPRCPPCTHAPMYPGGLTDGCYVATARARSVSLCFD